jgi:hypothetical protein
MGEIAAVTESDGRPIGTGKVAPAVTPYARAGVVDVALVETSARLEPSGSCSITGGPMSLRLVRTLGRHPAISTGLPANTVRLR